MNNTTETTCYIKLRSHFHILSLGIILGVIVFNLNVLIIVTILRTKKLHTNTNIIVLSIALFDCLMALSDFTHGLVYSTDLRFNIPASNIADTVLLGTGTTAVTLSCTHMAIIAIDRYINIAHPFYYIVNIKKGRLIVVLLVTWLFGLVYCSAPLIFYRDKKYHRHCIISHPPLEYFIINASLNLIDYVIICVCYFKIARLAFKHKKAAIARRLQTENPEQVFKLGRNRAAAMRSVKFFVCLFGTFFVFTFPPLVTTAMTSSYSIPDTALLSVLYFYEIHSCVNFILIVHLNNGFSCGLKKLLLDVSNFCKPQRADCNDNLDERLPKYKPHLIRSLDGSTVHRGRKY